MKLLCILARLIGITLVALVVFWHCDPTYAILAGGLLFTGLGPPVSDDVDSTRPNRRPLRFYRGTDGRLRFYRKVDPVRLEQLEHELGIGIVEPEPTLPPAPAKVLTSSGYRSMDQAMKSIASVYLVPPPMMARRQASNCNCAECNDYVVVPFGWKLKHYSAMEHYSDSYPPPLPVLTEPRDSL